MLNYFLSSPGNQFLHTIENSDKLMERRGHIEQEGRSRIPKIVIFAACIRLTFDSLGSIYLHVKP